MPTTTPRTTATAAAAALALGIAGTIAILDFRIAVVGCAIALALLVVAFFQITATLNNQRTDTRPEGPVGR